MRIDSRLAPIVAPAAQHDIQAVSAIHAVKPVARDAHAVPHATTPSAHALPDAAHAAVSPRREERRQSVRRMRKQPVLIELRLGADRRHHLHPYIDEAV